jgi:hypothetical protein
MTLERSARTRLTSAFVLLLVLASGMVLGVALDRRLEARSIDDVEATGTAERPENQDRRGGFDLRRRDSGDRGGEAGDSAQRRRPLLVDQVGLSEVQELQIDSIVGFYRGQMRALHEEFDRAYSSRYREIMAQTREEIRGVLDEEQRAAYDSILAERDRRRDENRRDSASGGSGRDGSRRHDH